VIQPLDPGSCRVTDTLHFRLRADLAAVPGAAALAAGIVAAPFRHRHRRLAKLYDVPDRR